MPNLSKIVTGVDFSESSHHALSWAAHHLAPDAEFILVHAVELPVPPSFLGESPDQTRIASQIHRAIVEDVEAVHGELPEVRMRTEVPIGHAYEELGRIAREQGADLVLVGPHGENAVLKDLVGSTAERILARSDVPVLLAAGDPQGPPRHILAAVDDTGARYRVLEWSRFLAEKHGATVTAFHCLDRRLFGRIRLVSSPGRIEDLEMKAMEDARTWLTSELTRHGLPSADENIHVSIGSPGPAISDLACNHHDLLVVGSRSEKAAERIFLGSVARRVIRRTCVPVLMVP
jgi:nucleotide-binding universal stress UspA family protein